MTRDEIEQKTHEAIAFDGWFRPPRHFLICPRGDAQRYLWVCEPKRGKVAGVGYEISYTALEAMDSGRPRDQREEAGSIPAGAIFEQMIKRAARRELMGRVRREDFHGEGQMWEAFEWNPAVKEMYKGGFLIDGFLYDPRRA